ncbi:unnamed protein product, partial [Didymodactylos carnosus]
FSERFIRLQHENKVLKLKQTEDNNSEQVQLLQANCDELKDRNNQLNNDLWMSNRKILELEATLKDASVISENSSELIELKKTLNRTTARCEDELTQVKSQLDELQKRYDIADQKLNEKDMLLKTNANEINSINEKYIRYLEKARTVIRSVDLRSNLSSNTEIQSLRKELKDKDQCISDLQREYERLRETREDQEKLLISAWYSLVRI